MMRKTPWLLVLGLLLASALAAAQPQRRERGPNRDRLRQNLIHLRLLRMTEALELTEEQTAKIYPLATRIEKEKADLVRQLGAEMAELRRLVDQDQPKAEDLASRVASIRQLRQSLRERDAEFEKSLEANLTEIQVAKYILFQADFNRLMGERLGRARAAMPGRRAT